GLNMKLINIGDVKKMDDKSVEQVVASAASDDLVEKQPDPQKNGLMAKLKEMVKKAVNCCIE
ncbi:MAG: hypothetical protein WCX77_03975, partial [Candidatus Paceibacterota bacterium]